MQAGWVILVLVEWVLAEDDFELGQVAADLGQVHHDCVGLNQGLKVYWGRRLRTHSVRWGSLCLAPQIQLELVLEDYVDPYPE